MELRLPRGLSDVAKAFGADQDFDIHEHGALVEVLELERKLRRLNPFLVRLMGIRGSCKNALLVRVPDGRPVSNAGTEPQNLPLLFAVLLDLR